MDASSVQSSENLQNYSYRELQLIAKRYGLPANVRKVDLIQMILSKSNNDEERTMHLVRQIQLERKQMALNRKPTKMKLQQVTEEYSNNYGLVPAAGTSKPIISQNVTRPNLKRRLLEKTKTTVTEEYSNNYGLVPAAGTSKPIISQNVMQPNLKRRLLEKTKTTVTEEYSNNYGLVPAAGTSKPIISQNVMQPNLKRRLLEKTKTTITEELPNIYGLVPVAGTSKPISQNLTERPNLKRRVLEKTETIPLVWRVVKYKEICCVYCNLSRCSFTIEGHTRMYHPLEVLSVDCCTWQGYISFGELVFEKRCDNRMLDVDSELYLLSCKYDDADTCLYINILGLANLLAGPSGATITAYNQHTGEKNMWKGIILDQPTQLNFEYDIDCLKVPFSRLGLMYKNNRVRLLNNQYVLVGSHNVELKKRQLDDLYIFVSVKFDNCAKCQK